jgi:quercetin dioxygenase-like cupin family protein
MTTATQTGIPAIERGEREGLWFIHDLATVHVRGEETGGAVGIVEIMAPPGDMPPLHVHQREDETFYVLEGELELHVGDSAPVRVLPGACTVAPRGIPHVYRVVSGEAARFLVVTTPAGFERFVAEASIPARENALPPVDAEPDMGRLMAAAAAAGIDIIAPPGTLPGDV